MKQEEKDEIIKDLFNNKNNLESNIDEEIENLIIEILLLLKLIKNTKYGDELKALMTFTRNICKESKNNIDMIQKIFE